MSSAMAFINLSLASLTRPISFFKSSIVQSCTNQQAQSDLCLPYSQLFFKTFLNHAVAVTFCGVKGSLFIGHSHSATHRLAGETCRGSGTAVQSCHASTPTTTHGPAFRIFV